MDTEKYYAKEIHIFKDLDELMTAIRKENESQSQSYR